MYVPSLFADDPALISEHVRRWPFATVFTSGAAGPQASHVPLVLAAPDRLVGHLARANPHADDLSVDLPCPILAVFHGPHAFVSSNWYQEPDKHVPTWNYLALHATGSACCLSDPTEALDLAMATLQPPDRVPSGHASRDAFLASLSRAIVAFEIRVHRWEGKAKLSQNRSPDDRERVRLALAASSDPMDQQVADEMSER